MRGSSFYSIIKSFSLLKIISAILFIISLIILSLNGVTPVGMLWAIYWPSLFLLLYVIITTPWRAVPLNKIWIMFLIGMSFVPAITFIAQYALYALVNIRDISAFFTSDAVLGNYDLMSPVVAPVTEEVLKVIPVVLFLWLGGKKLWREVLGPLDVALLAGASGAGFAFFENLLRVTAGDWKELGPDRVVPALSPQIGSIHLFPDMTGSNMYGVPSVWFGHAELTAFVGLAIGLGLYFRNKTRLWPLIPFAALLWAIWDHFIVNYLGPEPFQTWMQILPALDLYGGLLPYVFLALMIYACYISHRTQAWYIAKEPAASGKIDFGRVFSPLFSNPTQFISRISSFFLFRRLRLMTAFALCNISHSTRNTEKKLLLCLVRLRIKMSMALREVAGA